MAVSFPALAAPLPSRSQAARDAGVALAALLMIAAWEWSGLDLWLSTQYGGSGGFPWRDNWLVAAALHDGGRRLALLSLTVFAAFAFGLVRGGHRLQAPRYWWLVTGACLLLVPALKRISSTSCPWDLAAFGGRAAYVPHWLFGITDGGPGHCFPSGHAVSAFAFFGLYFMLRDTDRRAARRALGAVLAAGLLFSWAQLVRGAHFASHGMWSAWLCWAACASASAVQPLTAAARGA